MLVSPQDLAESARERSERHTITVDEIETACWFYPAVRTEAQTIVFVHGYRGNHHGLEAIAGALSDFNIWIPDLPGFGLSSEFAAVHDIDSYALWLTKLIPALGLRQPILLAHSFGTIVTAAALAGGVDAKAAILVNPVSAPALKGPRALMTYLTVFVHWLTGVLPESIGNSILRSFVFVRTMSVFMAKSSNSQLRRWIHLQHDSNFNNYSSRRVAIEGYSASISHNVSEYAKRISQPTLLIAGDKDDITAVWQQEQAVKLFKDSKLVVLPGVGHLTHYETPNEIATVVRVFIEGKF